MPTAVDFAAFAPVGDLLRELLAVSLTGVIVYTPIYNAAGEITDFTFEYLNPAAQRMMRMPERPTLTHNGQWPHSQAHGTLAFHIEAFVSGEPRRHDTNYQADGYDNYYCLAARRVGGALLVSFTDTADQARTPVEMALRKAQASVRAAQAEAEARQAELEHVFAQAPIGLVLFRGPEYRIDLANSLMGQIWGRAVPQVLGQPVFEAMPDLQSQGFEAILADVYYRGVPYSLWELPVTLARAHTGQPAQGFFNVIYQAQRDAQGTIVGIICLCIEVTDQVVARQQTQQLNDALEARNAEALAANAALQQTRQQLEHLNQELEGRVQARTEELGAQQQQLQLILGEVPASIALLTGPDYRHTFFNDAYQALSGGRARPDLPLAAVYPEASAQGFLDLLTQVYTTGQPYRNTDWPTQMLDPATGRPALHYLDFLYQPLPDAQGQTQSILVFVIDVTEKVLARQRAEALQADLLAAAQHQTQARETFYHVFEQTPALIQLLRSPGHRIEYVNPAYQRLFAGRQLVGRDLAEAIPELQAQGFITLLDRVYQTGETYYGTDVPFGLATAAGAAQTTYFTFTYQAYRENGQIAGISVFATDVSEQVAARQAREAQQQELEQLFMQAPTPIVILEGPDLVFQLVNPAYQRIFPGRELVNKALLDALPELVGTPIPGLFHQVYHTGEPVVVQELPLMMARHEGQALEEIYWTFTYQARRDAHGAIDGVRVFAHDITEQVRTRDAVAASAQQALALATELATANQQLVRVNVDLDTFIYTASHDLKAPITNIEGLLYTLQGELPAQSPAGEVAYILDLMQDSVERFKHTIEHLTDVSKLHKALDEPAHPVPLAAVIEGVRLDLAPLLHATGGHLDVDVRAVATVIFSEKNLRSVVFNLLSNALKYHHPDRAPQVRVRAHLEGAYAVLAVQDNGLGIDLAREAQLFAMFQRLHTHVEGSGVGLYMVKRLVENAGGHITVSSSIGVGSTFTVYLPC